MAIIPLFLQVIAPKAKAKGKAKAKAIRAEPKFSTPDCLLLYRCQISQSLYQDRRENRFKCFDRRTATECACLRGHFEYERQHFSASYGAKRSHRDALALVITWLHGRQELISGVIIPPISLPPVGEETHDLKEALEAPLAHGYYKK